MAAVVELLCESSRIALSFTNKKNTEIKSDLTLVTAADKAVEDYLNSALEDTRESAYLIGEETYAKHSGEYLSSALQNTAWVIDPIDGTALYAHDIPLWGTSIGFAQKGVLREGGVIVPCTGEMLISKNGVTYYAKDVKTLEAKDYMDSLEELAPPCGEFGTEDIIGLSQRAARRWTTDLPNTVNSFCTTVYENILVATSRHYCTLSCAKLWDHAGTVVPMRNLKFESTLLGNDGDMMSGEITEKIYNLDYSSPKAFALKGMIALSPTREASERILASFKDSQKP